MMRCGRYPDSPLTRSLGRFSLPRTPFARDRDPKKSKPKLVKTRADIQRTLANNAREKSSCSRGRGSCCWLLPFRPAPFSLPCPALPWPSLLLHGGGGGGSVLWAVRGLCGSIDLS